MVQDIPEAWSGEAGVVNTACIDDALVFTGHDQLDLAPHAVQTMMVRKRPKASDGANILSVTPGPVQVHDFGVEVLHSTAENQQSLHLRNLRDAGYLKERWLHWRCVHVGGRNKDSRVECQFNKKVLYIK